MAFRVRPDASEEVKDLWAFIARTREEVKKEWPWWRKKEEEPIDKDEIIGLA